PAVRRAAASCPNGPMPHRLRPTRSRRRRGTPAQPGTWVRHGSERAEHIGDDRSPRPSTAPAMGPSVRPTPVGPGSGVSVLAGSEQAVAKLFAPGIGGMGHGSTVDIGSAPPHRCPRKSAADDQVTLSHSLLNASLLRMTNGARRNCKWQRHIHFTPPDFAASRDRRARAWPMSRRENVFRHVAPRSRS
ncbi:MAG: hypothetical protein QOK33_98, partial [Mycobacterium sp.]|nr:hypothetical protein [Mycobacterium sp.]